jgi:hypothetical protein
MSAYLLGIGGWLITLALQIFFARRASAKRRAVLKDYAERRPMSCTVVL